VDAAVVVDRLRVVRGGRAVLDGLSLTVEPGSVTGLLGPSGCGKTTLMRAVVGVQALAGGRVTVLGRPAGCPPLRRRVAYVTQAPSVYGDLTVDENLRYFAAIARADGRDVDRVSLASALIGRPELLILDEPTVGLDPVLRAELWATFGALAREGRTLLISSHVMDEAAACDALLLMRDGELVAATTPDRLRAATGEHDLGAAFLTLIRGSA
jgi:ABC-2 type transport system ATP-binding protein